MAAAVQSTQPATSFELTTHGPSTDEVISTNSHHSHPPRSPARSNSHRRAPTSPVPKHAKRQGNQPILLWLQRKIGGNKHPSKKRHHSEHGSGSDTTESRTTKSSETVAPSKDETIRHGRKHGSHKATTITPSTAHADCNTTSPSTDVAAAGGETKQSSNHSRSAKSDSLRPDSAWGLHKEPEADDDASIRPLPPTSPPSPVPSGTTRDSERTSGGYTSDLRSARSAGAPSTKPTTLMSIEMGAGGHIAQAPSISSSIVIPAHRGPQFASPPTPTNPSPVSARFPHTHTRGGSIPGATSVSFSPLPANPTASRSTTATSTVPGAVNNMISDTAQNTSNAPVVSSSNTTVPKLAIQVPGHSQLHPRNNPRPASPPPDNASTLTLASSTFAMSYASPRSRSAAADRERDLDAAASMRALRPSSRRGSWGSDETGYSAAGASTHTGLSSAGPLMLAFGGPGSVTGLSAGHKRRGPGSIATARSAWSYRAGGGPGTLDGLDTQTIDDDEDCGSEDGDRATRVTADELTPTEDVVLDFATTSPTSIAHSSALAHEIPLPPSPEVTTVDL